MSIKALKIRDKHHLKAQWVEFVDYDADDPYLYVVFNSDANDGYGEYSICTPQQIVEVYKDDPVVGL